MKQKLITDYFDNLSNKKVKTEKIDNEPNEYDVDSNFDFDESESVINKHIQTDKKKIFGYNPVTESWHCILCGIDMGFNNPRQLCGKTYCDNLVNY